MSIADPFAFFIALIAFVAIGILVFAIMLGSSIIAGCRQRRWSSGVRLFAIELFSLLGLSAGVAVAYGAARFVRWEALPVEALLIGAIVGLMLGVVAIMVLSSATSHANSTFKLWRSNSAKRKKQVATGGKATVAPAAPAN